MREKLYPFFKNKYFKKKRIRAADFERDQDFTDNKLSFLNHWVFGEGVALGLDVQRIDSESILVEPGFAVDALGRYLIVDEPVARRIKTLEGFESLKTETAVLWVYYKEKLLEPVFVADDTGGSTQYSVAQETVGLMLKDNVTLPVCAAERALVSVCVLFSDDDIQVRQEIPRFFSKDGITSLRLIIESFSPEPLELDIKYKPEIIGFMESESKAELKRRLRVEKGETLLQLEMKPADTSQNVIISLGENSFIMEKQGKRHISDCKFSEKFQVASGDPSKALESYLATMSMEELWDGCGDGIPLAYLRFIKYDDKVMLDEVVPVGLRGHAPVPYLKEYVKRAADFYSEEKSIPTDDPEPDPEEPLPDPENMTTGSIVLNIGLNKKEGNIVVSDEISHELGPGPVFVEFGIENIYPIVNYKKNRTDLLLGDVSLFEQPSGTYEKNFDKGVKVHPDKGTFELALRLHGNVGQTSLRLRWFAFKPCKKEEKPEEYGKLMRLEPNVVKVKPGECVHFSTVFSSGAPAPCEFFTEDRHGGAVTRSGDYTAPDWEGLFRVYAQVKGKPEERANAFIIVEKTEEDGEKADGQ